jgi:putative endonuclease
MTTDHILGKLGEKTAKNYLEKSNFSILKTNWRYSRFGEIDIIAEDIKTKELVFIEVKCRQSSLDDAKELVTPKKQQKLYKLASLYLHLEKKKEETACRFDVIAIKINERNKEIEHIKNAF